MPDEFVSQHTTAKGFICKETASSRKVRWSQWVDATLARSLLAGVSEATVQVTLKEGHYTGETTVKQSDFGIKLPGKASIRAKDEVRIEFDVQLAS